MAEVSKTVLKSYFNQGDKPTESQFGDLIDTFITEASATATGSGVLTVTSSANPTNGANLFSNTVSAEQMGFYAGSKLQAVVKNNAISGDTNVVNYLVLGGGDDLTGHIPSENHGHVLIAASGTNSSITMRLQSTGPEGQIHFYQNGVIQANIGITGNGSENWSSAYINLNKAHDGINSSISIQTSSADTQGLDFYTTGSGNFTFYSRNRAIKLLDIVHVASAENYLKIAPSLSAANPRISVSGAGTNIGVDYVSQALGIHTFTNSSAKNWAQIAGPANAASYIALTAAASAANVAISQQGTDSNAGMNIYNASTSGSIDFYTSNLNARHLKIFHTVPNCVNFVSLTGAPLGSGPIVTVSGTSDADIKLTLSPKGSANVQLGIDAGQGLVVGVSALSTTATNGMVWIPSCAGSAAGTATAPFTNAAGLVYDSTNNFLWARCGGTWRASPAFSTGGIGSSTFTDITVTTRISAGTATADFNTVSTNGITLSTNAQITMGTNSIISNAVATVNCAGTTQGTAAALAKTPITLVGTASDGSATGVILLSNLAGVVQYIVNTTISANLWPCVGGQINALASNAAFGMAPNTLYTIVHTRASGYSVK